MKSAAKGGRPVVEHDGAQQWPGGLSLHALRHSAATHLGEAGTDATVIMAKGH